MKKFLVLAFSFCAVLPLSAQTPMDADAQRTVSETRGLVANALAGFQKANPEQLKMMGFGNAQALETAKPTEPLPVYMVELEALRAYPPGADPTNLLKPIDKVIYPLSSGGRIQSSLIMQRGKEGWHVSTIGGGNFARLASSARDQLARSANMQPNAFFIVQVPALSAAFIGFHQGDRIMLSSLTDDPALNLRSGTPIPAEQVLGQLVPAAKEHNGLPM